MKAIQTAILANTPVIYVVSPEEERFTEALQAFCRSTRRKLWLHTISEGLWNIAFSRPDSLWVEACRDKVKAELRDPISLLDHMKAVGKDEGVFLLLDFHETLSDAVVRRLVKDVGQRFAASNNTMIVLAPVLVLPKVLEHDVAVMDFPLPTEEDIQTALQGIVTTLKQQRYTVDLTKGDMVRLAASGRGLTLREFENGVAKSVIRRKGRLDKHLVDDVVAEKKQIIRKTGMLEFFDHHENLGQVGGLTVLKDWLAKRERAFSEEARAFGLPVPKGLLLLGVQGCGKSLTAKACAALYRFPLLRLDTGRLFSSQVGSSEENVRLAIRIAEAVAPCVVWIDEIEKAMAGVGSSAQSDAGTAARVFATLATWLQEKSAPVFVIATANSVTSLPPEFIRKGRFDDVFFLDLPGLGERRDIFDIHLRKRRRNPSEFDVNALADQSDGYSGAEIEQAIIDALYDAFDQGRRLATEDILCSLAHQVPLSQTMAESIDALREWARVRARWASKDKLDEQRRQWREHDLRPI